MKLIFTKWKILITNFKYILGSSTLPRSSTTRTNESGDKVVAATSSTSLYDNVASNSQQQQPGSSSSCGVGVGGAAGTGTQTGSESMPRPKSETGTMTGDDTIISATQNHVGAQIQTEERATLQRQESKSEGTQAGGTLQHATKSTTSTGTGTRSKDYGDECGRDPHEMHIINNNARRSKSKSTEDMNVGKKTIYTRVAYQLH